MDYSMTLVVISLKGDNYPYNDEIKYNNKREPLYQPEDKGEFPTFSVPTKGQRRKPFRHIEISNKSAK
jgi:hypothetical protein